MAIVISIGVAMLVVVGTSSESGGKAAPYLAVLALLLVLPNWGRNGLRRLLDYWLLGVCGRRYLPATGEVEFRFRDPALELSVQQLSADRRTEALALATEHLTPTS